MYIFYGTDLFLVQKEINKIKEKEKIDDLNIISYDLSVCNIKDIIEDANTYSLFGTTKIIIAENALFLTGKGSIPDDISLLEEYIHNPNKSTILIFTVLEEKLDERKKIVKSLKTNSIIKECKKEDVFSFIKSSLDDYIMDDKTVRLLIDRVGNDFKLISNELEKLKLYKLDEKKIIEEDVIKLTSKNISLDIFEFIDDILYKRKEKALETLKELLKRNTEPIAVIVMLAGQIRIMYESKELRSRGYTENDIAKLLEIHPFRVKKALEKGYKYSSSTLRYYLEQLEKLDVDIKRGNINKDFALELFILGVWYGRKNKRVRRKNY